ncbi:MAG: nucleotidyltransferase substrate binding protein [Methylococcales bacterium]|jgi:nucleotidyltransferase substrate binding protein (TIGR01987 family)
MTTEDIRWKQRFFNYKRALLQLNNAVELNQQRPLSNLEKQGLIQSFEYCHELAWNVLKDFFEYQGKTSMMGSRDATREAFNRDLLSNGEAWMQMITSRNQTSHTYDEAIADAIAKKIITIYQPLFVELQHKMQMLYDAN